MTTTPTNYYPSMNNAIRWYVRQRKTLRGGLNDATVMATDDLLNGRIFIGEPPLSNAPGQQSNLVLIDGGDRYAIETTSVAIT